jgi:hypothetical protein
MARMDEKPRRRWFRFSLRTFLVFVTLFCVWAAWWTHAARQQKQAVEAVREYGGWVYYDYEFDDDPQRPQRVTNESPWPSWLVDTFGVDMLHNIVEVNLVYGDDNGKREETKNTSDEIIGHLEGFPNLRRLFLHSTQVTDATMPHIAKLRKLECLLIWKAEMVSDAGFSHLASLGRLKTLQISNAQLGDESLAIMGHLPQIESLSLQGNHFSNKGLSYLTQMPRLKSLAIGLGHDSITDEGVSHLEELQDLEELDLQGCTISDAGLTHLQKLTKLKHLYLGNETRITDQGIAILATLTNLEVLMLCSPTVTSEGFESLSDLKKLTELFIGPNISPNHPLYQSLPSCQIMRCTLSGQGG